MKQDTKNISGFSKWPKEQKIDWLVRCFFEGDESAAQDLKQFWHDDTRQQQVFDGFSENTISNFILPYGVAPNFVINGKTYAVPMVIEESSVVAAASSAAKFWMSRGGFWAEVIDTRKLGQVHFSWKGDPELLFQLWPDLKIRLLEEASMLTANMEKRGGGVLDVELINLTHMEPNYYQLMVSFETCDSMGANFINSVLESFGRSLESFAEEQHHWPAFARDIEVIMAILSNYTPQCLVRTWVECPVDELEGICEGMNARTFAEKFAKAIRIAQIDPYRAVTHNKGIFNGIDAVVLATGNDFRAIEACGHAYAARDGHYRSLSHCMVEGGIFRFWMDIPLAVGTVGGLTNLHPLARRSLQMLGHPGAIELMMVIAVTGLAQNFAAVRSLITTGIQKGHMKMHLMNILQHLGAKEPEIKAALSYFEHEVVSFNAVRQFLEASQSNSR